MSDGHADNAVLEEPQPFINQGRRMRRGQLSDRRSHRLTDREGLLRQIYHRLMQAHASQLDPLSPLGAHVSPHESVEPFLPRGEHDPDLELSEMTDDILSQWRRTLEAGLADHRHTASRRPMMADTGSVHSLSYADDQTSGILRTLLVFVRANWRKICLVLLGLTCLLLFEERGGAVPSNPHVDRFTQLVDCAEKLSPGADLSDYHSPENRAVEWIGS